eukprot:12213891-Alexandrium_andersonii.AAC.1
MFGVADVRTCSWAAWGTLARNGPSNYDGEAIIAGGVRARVSVAVVGTTGLCMCSERLAHVRWG